MSWLERLGMGGPPLEKKPGDTPPAPANPQHPERGKGLRTQLREKTEAYQEAIGLLQQFVGEGLKRACQIDSSLYPSSMMHFAELKHHSRGHFVEMRVPGHDEAKALQKIMRASLGLADSEPSPLERQERSTVERGRVTYIVFFNTTKYTPQQCKEALEKALRHMGVEPNWKGHYVPTDHAAEAEFRTALRKMDEEHEAGDKNPRGGSGLGGGRS